MQRSKEGLMQIAKVIVCVFLKISEDHAESLSWGWTSSGKIPGWLCFDRSGEMSLTVNEGNILAGYWNSFFLPSNIASLAQVKLELPVSHP